MKASGRLLREQQLEPLDVVGQHRLDPAGAALVQLAQRRPGQTVEDAAAHVEQAPYAPLCASAFDTPNMVWRSSVPATRTAASTATTPVVHRPSCTARIRSNTAKYGTATMSPDSVAQTMEATRVLAVPTRPREHEDGPGCPPCS